MTKRKSPPDVQSVNPRYRGAMMSDVVRVLLRPKNPTALGGDGAVAGPVCHDGKGGGMTPRFVKLAL